MVLNLNIRLGGEGQRNIQILGVAILDGAYP